MKKVHPWPLSCTQKMQPKKRRFFQRISIFQNILEFQIIRKMFYRSIASRRGVASNSTYSRRSSFYLRPSGRAVNCPKQVEADMTTCDEVSNFAREISEENNTTERTNNTRRSSLIEKIFSTFGDVHVGESTIGVGPQFKIFLKISAETIRCKKR